MASEDDEDLKKAIALSLRDEHGGKERAPRDVISLDSSDEDDAASKRPAIEHDETSESRLSNRDAVLDTKPADSALGFLELDRKKMEEERLARKRKTSISPPPNRKTPKSSAHKASDKAHAPYQATATTYKPTLPFTNTSSPSNGHPSLQYPEGVVKKTWAYGHARRGDDIKLEEVLQKDDLNSAVLSSFMWDMSWLIAKINKATRITFVMQAKDESTKSQYRQETANMPNLRLCFPSMEGQINCMHSKLMLLSHPSYLRIVVPTANLVPFDWGETGEMENMVFLIDLPRLPTDYTATPTKLTAFGRDLIDFLEAVGLEQSMIDSIPHFDFSATKDLAFVHTIGGAHGNTNGTWRRTGYCGLGRAVKALGLATKTALQLDFVTSSVGSLNQDFLAMLYLAAQGDDGMTEYRWRNPETGKSKPKKSKTLLADEEAAQVEIREDVRKGFHVYFPTHDTVKASTAGGAGTICFQSKWYDSPNFPREVMRDCRSTRPVLLMHNKLIYVSPQILTNNGAPSTSWAYIGSANCSESAWGKLIKDRTTKAPKLNCRNWECGVVFPLRRVGSSKVGGGIEDIKGVVPVPMEYPGEIYGDRKPWYFMEQ